MKDQFYRQTTLQVLERLHATPQGLLTTEAMERLQKNGPNELPQGKKITLWQRIIAQFKDLMILILIVAAFAGELSDTIIILLVVVLNAAFGVFQETKAENAIDALQKMSTPTTRVRRDGQIAQLSSKELVVGDVILLEAGDIIPADVRFLKTQNVKVEEAALTGESVAVTKDEAVIDAESAALGDQHNMGFMNTSMTAGTAEAVVVATGKDTEVGKIAQMLNSAEQTVTPLQRNITHLSKILSVLVLAIAVIIFALGMLTKRLRRLTLALGWGLPGLRFLRTRLMWSWLMTTSLRLLPRSKKGARFLPIFKKPFNTYFRPTLAKS